MSMTAAQRDAKVREIVMDQLGVDEDEVTPEATLRDSLGCDSLDTIELALAFEEEFGLEISDDDIERLKTVGDIYDYLAQHAKS